MLIGVEAAGPEKTICVEGAGKLAITAYISARSASIASVEVISFSTTVFSIILSTVLVLSIIVTPPTPFGVGAGIACPPDCGAVGGELGV